METVNTPELKDENIFPDETVLENALGESYQAYLELLKLYENNGLTWEWRYYNDGKAWLCKVQKKKKTIVWMSVWKGFFNAALYFPERLLGEILALEISEPTKEKIQNTKNVGKSRPCIFEVRNTKILKDLETVMLYKISAK